MQQNLASLTYKPSLSQVPDISSLSASNKSSSRLRHLGLTKSTELSPAYTKRKILLIDKQESGLVQKALKSLGKNLEQPLKNLQVSNHKETALNRKISLKKLVSPRGTKNSPVEAVLKEQSGKIIKFANVGELIEENMKVFNCRNEGKVKSWLENIVMVKEFELKSGELENNLRFCNNILKDVLIRLKQTGKENEASLIEKIWRINYEAIDMQIESLENQLQKAMTEVNSNENKFQVLLQDIKSIEIENEKKIKEIEEYNKKIISKLNEAQLKNDEYQSKLLKISKFEGSDWILNKVSCLEPIVARIGDKLQYLEGLSNLHGKKRFFSGGENLLRIEDSQSGKCKDLVRKDFIDRLIDIKS